MPYTQEELQSLEWYQNLLDEDDKSFFEGVYVNLSLFFNFDL